MKPQIKIKAIDMPLLWKEAIQKMTGAIAPVIIHVCYDITARQLPGHQHPEDQPDRPGKDPGHLAVRHPEQP